MTKPLQNKVALITGGARGIGRAIAIKLAQAGCHIIVNYYNSSDVIDSLCTELQSYGVKALGVQANVSDPASIKEMFATIQNDFDHIDILINNAASGVLKPTMEMSLKHWRWCAETNALALVFLLQAAKEMMPVGSRVVAMTSMGSQRVIPDYGFIGASKAALESLVRSLSVELAPAGITLNTICAGAVDTDALKHFPERERLLKQSEERSLAGRNVTPEDVANAVYLLCLPEAEMLKGQTIIVDAGYSIIG
ncbi:MAG: enoyl-[acyl-carrier-protein] reductase FabL [Gammaproteobacteria bacterium]